MGTLGSDLQVVPAANRAKSRKEAGWKATQRNTRALSSRPILTEPAMRRVTAPADNRAERKTVPDARATSIDCFRIGLMTVPRRKLLFTHFTGRENGMTTV